MTNVEQNQSVNEVLSLDVLVKINTLRQAMNGMVEPVKRYNLLSITTVESLERQMIALNAFRTGADSIKGWDFVKDVPVKVVNDLDIVIAAVKDLQKDMVLCGNLLQGCGTYVDWFTSNTTAFASAESYVSYLQQITQAHSVVDPNLKRTEAIFAKLKIQAETNASACDRANETISEFISSTAARSVVLTQDKDIEYIDKGKDLCSKGLESANKLAGEPICEKCIAGLNFLINLTTELVKEAAIQFKASQMPSAEAFSKLGPYDIAIAGAIDTMRVINFFLDTFDTVIPYFTYIKDPLRIFAKTYVESSVTRAKQLDKEASDPTAAGFWTGFKEGLLEGFKEKFEELMDKLKDYASDAEEALQGELKLPEDFIQKTIEIVVTAFAEQIVGRLPIKPAEKHDGAQLDAYVNQLKSSYKAGLEHMSPGIKQKIEAFGY
jgi:hypothetical protein